MTLLSLIPGLLLVAVTGTVSEGTIRDAVREVYEADEYQVDMRSDTAPGGGTPAGSSASPADATGSRFPKGLPGISEALVPAIEFLLWIVAIVAVILVGIWLAREWGPFWPGGPRARIRRQARDRAVTAGVEPVVREERPEFLPHAEAGRFTEAVHAILLALQWEIGIRRRAPFDPALTSREILVSSRLPAEAAEPFRRIVAVVEGGRFGGKRVDGTEYEACAGDYRAVLTALPGARA